MKVEILHLKDDELIEKEYLEINVLSHSFSHGQYKHAHVTYK